jgi:serine/threonine protein kinase
VGSIDYTAPETVSGEYDHLADIYSFGITMLDIAGRYLRERKEPACKAVKEAVLEGEVALCKLSCTQS